MTHRSERPVLALVGGNGSTAARFQRAWPWLEAQFQPVVVELAGQGSREAAALPDTLQDFAEDLAAALERVQAEVCYGHGVGALVLAHAVRLVDPQPERLVLHTPVGAYLARRRFPRLMTWGPLRALVRAMLASRVVGPRLAARLLDPSGAATEEDRREFAVGYGKARSFGALFTAIDPLAALDGLDALNIPVTLLWGLADRVLHPDQLLPWAEALAAAPSTARLVPGWRHYPFLDWPEAFAAVLAECVADRLPEEPVSLDHLHFYRPRTKAGRLAGMRRAGLPVPGGWWVPGAAIENGSAERLFRSLGGRYAVRSSALLEDQPGHTAAGVFTSLLDVAPRDLMDACREVIASGNFGFRISDFGFGANDATLTIGQRLRTPSGLGPSVASPKSEIRNPKSEIGPVDVILQEMVAPRAGGVAWVRGLGVDLEIAAGRIERGVSGAAPVARAWLSVLGKPWTAVPAELPGGLDAGTLRRRVWPELRRVHALLECGTLDVEWTVDEAGTVRLLQARPVGERHGARRLLTAANLREIVPPEPSPFFVSATDAAHAAGTRYYGRHDHSIGAWREPFSVSLGGHVFLNADLLVAVMDRWGVPRALITRGIGGRLPGRALRPGRFLASLPVLSRVLWDFCHIHPGSRQALEALRVELEAARDLPGLAAWFERAFAVFITQNLRIAGALSIALPLWTSGPPEVVTATMARELRALGAAPPPQELAAFESRWGHRGEYESDPASPRGEETRAGAQSLALEPRRFLPDPLQALPLPLRRLPILAPRHMRAHREWFRDGATRLWAAFRARMLHHAREHAARGELGHPDDVWQLTAAELRMLLPESWRERAAARRAAPHPPPIEADLFWSDTLAPLGSAPLGRLLLVHGTATGPALVARTPSEALALMAELPAGDDPPVLIAPAVDPGWLPVFVRVGGVAAELGGRLSHAATLLRELAIPSVLNLDGATQSARTGQRVRLRVPPGTVEVVASPPPPNDRFAPVGLRETESWSDPTGGESACL